MVFVKKYFPPLFFALSFIIFLKAFFLPGYPDFLVHYYSPQVLLLGGNPYTFSHLAFFPDVYPPATILFFFPFTIFPLIVAERLWFVVSLACLLLSVYLIFKIGKKNLFSGLGFLVLAFVFLSFPVKFNFGMGQINTLVLFLTTLSIFLLSRKRIFPSVLSLTLSLSMKFFPLFLPFYFVISKKWKYLLWSVVVFVALNFLIFLLYPDLVIYFYTKVVFQFIGGWKLDYYNQSLTGFIGRVIQDHYWREIVRLVLTLFFVLASLWIIIKTRTDKLVYLHFSLLITLGLLVSNFSWQHHFVFMLFPFLFNLFYLMEKKSYQSFFVLIISYVLISFNFKNPQDFPVIITSHVFYGTVLMWMLEVYVILKEFPRLQSGFVKGRRH